MHLRANIPPKPSSALPPEPFNFINLSPSSILFISIATNRINTAVCNMISSEGITLSLWCTCSSLREARLAPHHRLLDLPFNIERSNARPDIFKILWHVGRLFNLNPHSDLKASSSRRWTSSVRCTAGSRDFWSDHGLRSF